MSYLLFSSVKLVEISKFRNIRTLLDFRLKIRYSTNSLKLNQSSINHPIDQLAEQDKLNNELKMQQRNFRFNQNIKAYVDVCCRSKKLLNNALNLIETLTRQEDHSDIDSIVETTTDITIEPTTTEPKIDPTTKVMTLNSNKDTKLKTNYCITDVEIYNKLMFTLAKTGQTHRIIRLFNKMKSSSAFNEPIKPNLNSYVAAIQSIGYNLNTNPELDINSARLSIERIIFDIAKAKFSLDDLATSLFYSNEQQKDITKAINLVIPNFNFKDVEDKTKLNSLFFKLNTNKKNADDFNLIYLPEEIAKKEKMLKNFDAQIEKERQIMINVPSILNNEKNKIKIEKEKEIIMRHFQEAITKSFMINIELLKDSTKKDKAFIYPFLAVMDKSVYIELLMKEICILAQNSEYFTSSLHILSINLANRLEKKFHEFCLNNENELDKLRKIYEKYIDYKIEILSKPSQNNQREEWLKIMRKENLFLTAEDNNWPTEIKLNVGKYLIENILLKSCFLPASTNTHRYNHKVKYEKAFYKIYRITGVYKDPQLKIHPYLTNLFSNSLLFEAYRMPMVTPPLPWYSPAKGGYFLSKSNLLRLKPGLNEQRILIENTDPSNMYPIYDSLNTLSSCAWRINKRILDLIVSVFIKKGNKDLDVSQPSSEGPSVPKLQDKASKEEFKAYLREKSRIEKIRSEMHSLWCTELYRLSIANMFRDTIIWFPHSLDFRGRSYPIPPHFNHLGSDIARSLILFAEGNKLGKNGLDMLKIHLINLTGTMKKSTIAERLEYANSIIDDIIDSAVKPFDGNLWWQKSEEKWQTLACCMEINDAIKSGNPENFISYYPIHQDGSCNGLQHYAALGRDQDGAESVNLAPSERPQDVYSTVLDLVEKFRESEENTNELASILKGHVKRKVIKQTVMTTVYNVTYYGAKLQILRQLEYLKDFPPEKAIEASNYLAEKTFQSINKLFFAAREIQEWLSQCAHLISNDRKSTVKWETPLGLPITQPYFRYGLKFKNEKPDARKQRNAFPPNYIHSLDSCHMMLTSLYCEKAGITFVSVHDCFWTHAASVDIMNRICREQFVALHSLPLLENLSDFFIKNYGYTRLEIESELDPVAKESMINLNRVLTNVPKKGSFDLNNVLKSVYFFS